MIDRLETMSGADLVHPPGISLDFVRRDFQQIETI